MDNFSIDRTVEIAKRYGARVIQVRGERAKAENIGLSIARGKHILFIDSDMELHQKKSFRIGKKVKSVACVSVSLEELIEFLQPGEAA